MKRLFTLTFILFSFFAQADYWTQKADFPVVGRELPVSFAIGDKGYVGCGYDLTNFLNDFWEYDPVSNSWTQKANFAGAPRFAAVGFSINNKGYVGTGGVPFVNDFWEYDPATDIWTQKANFGGLARTAACGFSINNKGYIGSGSGFFDFWEYDPFVNTWTQKADCGNETISGVGFSINGKGYFCAGGGLPDVWEYDPVLNSWSQKADLLPIDRYDCAGFALCDKGYVGTGEHPLLNDFWQFDPVLNQWIQKTDVPGPDRDDCASFSIGNKGYLGLGHAGILLTDFWEYTPDSACATGIEEELSNSNLQFSISPNRAKEFIVISYPLSVKENITITITNAEGKKVYESKLLTSDFRLPTSGFQKGIYFVELTNGKQKAVKKFVKE